MMNCYLTPLFILICTLYGCPCKQLLLMIREAIRQCFLFSNHLIITTRTHAGRWTGYLYYTNNSINDGGILAQGHKRRFEQKEWGHDAIVKLAKATEIFAFGTEHSWEYHLRIKSNFWTNRGLTPGPIWDTIQAPLGGGGRSRQPCSCHTHWGPWGGGSYWWG